MRLKGGAGGCMRGALSGVGQSTGASQQQPADFPAESGEGASGWWCRFVFGWSLSSEWEKIRIGLSELRLQTGGRGRLLSVASKQLTDELDRGDTVAAAVVQFEDYARVVLTAIDMNTKALPCPDIQWADFGKTFLGTSCGEDLPLDRVRRGFAGNPDVASMNGFDSAAQQGMCVQHFAHGFSKLLLIQASPDVNQHHNDHGM